MRHVGRGSSGVKISREDFERLLLTPGVSVIAHSVFPVHGRRTAKGKRSAAAIAHQRAAQKRHGELKHAAMMALMLEGCWVWSQTTGSVITKDGRWIRMGTAGMTDIIGSIPRPCFLSEAPRLHAGCRWCGGTGTIPRGLAVEVKTGTGALNDDQTSFLAEARRRGWFVFVCRDTVDDLVVAVREAMR